MSDNSRPEWFARALELFVQGFDCASCALIASGEWRARCGRLDADERPSKPPGRTVGAERNG